MNRGIDQETVINVLREIGENVVFLQQTMILIKETIRD